MDDPFGNEGRRHMRTPPQTNPFVNSAAQSGWSTGRGRGGGGGLFDLSGARRSTPGNDPFGGSSIAGFVDREQQLQRVRTFFSDEVGFKTEMATVTTSGMLLRVTEMANSEQVLRRLVVKASFPEVRGAVARERDWVYHLRFARHIVKWLSLSPDLMAPRPGNEGFRMPYFFVEYLESGTLGQFQKRIENVATLRLTSRLEIPFLLPNRLLWSIFLCLIRACVAMAWPPEGPDVVFEVPTQSEPWTLAHMDMHNNNVMFGNIDDNEAEHRVMPVVKLIDLGEALERPVGESRFPPDQYGIEGYDNVLLLATHRPNTGRRNQGIDKNLLDVGVLMANLVSNTQGFVITCRRNITDTNIHPYLDKDLRVLIQRCLAVDPENRPRLEELIELVGQDNSPFFRDEDYYRRNKRPEEAGVFDPAEELETDDALKVIVQMYILNADTNSFP
ncbi:hypothetical protein F4678DRAFT_474467 [Xylaria arbuscula]|nr:hypothetical protein F4678DRAFT_474467 [Xylaria arbuscula]